MHGTGHLVGWLDWPGSYKTEKENKKTVNNLSSLANLSTDTVLLARPGPPLSSATHNLSRRPFAPKNQRRLLPCLLYKSFFNGFCQCQQDEEVNFSFLFSVAILAKL